MRSTRLTAIVLIVSGLALIVSGLAIPGASCAEEDHLQGYRVKDLDRVRPAGAYTISGDFGSATCELKKAKFFLVQGEKNGGDDPRGGAAGEFICYTATCSGGQPSGQVEVDDQFGTHTLEARKTRIICAPADKYVCGDGDLDPGEQCDGAVGPCPTTCTSSCTCGPLPCQATTGGFCWYLGAPDANCATTCAEAFRAYDSATASFAGSDGSDANCTQVLADLGTAGPDVVGQSCGSGIGCAFGVVGIRCTTPPTNATDATAARRACACQ